MIEGSPPLSAGETVAPGYEVIAHLHRSNNFDVYDVWSQERACRCIAKALCPDLLDIQRTRRRLVREGRLLQRLTHPHIVRAYETIKEPHPVLILETLTGSTLAYLIDNSSRRLPLSDVIHLGLHLCSAVQYLHRHDILHLDLKPSNIVSERQLAKLLDLSLARSPGKGIKGAGTANYMAPEQARGDSLGPAADVWGLGAVLFEATTGEEPFDAYDEDETRYEQLERRADPIRSHRRIPAAFAKAIDACLEPDPARRPTLRDLTKSLNELV